MSITSQRTLRHILSIFHALTVCLAVLYFQPVSRALVLRRLLCVPLCSARQRAQDQRVISAGLGHRGVRLACDCKAVALHALGKRRVQIFFRRNAIVHVPGSLGELYSWSVVSYPLPQSPAPERSSRNRQLTLARCLRGLGRGAPCGECVVTFTFLEVHSWYTLYQSARVFMCTQEDWV